MPYDSNLFRMFQLPETNETTILQYPAISPNLGHFCQMVRYWRTGAPGRFGAEDGPQHDCNIQDYAGKHGETPRVCIYIHIYIHIYIYISPSVSAFTVFF
jgi:hypothetical protein